MVRKISSAVIATIGIEAHLWTTTMSATGGTLKKKRKGRRTKKKEKKEEKKAACKDRTCGLSSKGSAIDI